MVMITAKLSKRKILLIAAVLIAAVVVLSLCLGGSRDTPSEPDAAQAAADVSTNEGRIAFLQSFGWEISPEPVQTQEVRVPAEENEVFRRYNELQRSQGYDLTQYAGKTLRRYVYTISNYPGGDGAYYATLLVYKNDVAGGDVSSAAQNGVMHALTMPSTARAE